MSESSASGGGAGGGGVSESSASGGGASGSSASGGGASESSASGGAGFAEPLIPIPRNMFVGSLDKRDVFAGSLLERKADLEQFFWTQDCVARLLTALEHVDGRACLTAPSLAHAWHTLGQEEVCLDIDRRFDYLPRFHYYDVRAPYALEGDDADFRVLILDPPYFVVPIEQFRRAVDVLTGSNYKIKLLVGFLHREEKRLLEAFKPYGLRPTAFPLEYASIKPSKWPNFCLYSNVDLPGIRRK